MRESSAIKHNIMCINNAIYMLVTNWVEKQSESIRCDTRISQLQIWR